MNDSDGDGDGDDVLAVFGYEMVGKTLEPGRAETNIFSFPLCSLSLSYLLKSVQINGSSVSFDLGLGPGNLLREIYIYRHLCSLKITSNTPILKKRSP